MADPSNVLPVRLRLTDVWGGREVIRELTLADLETSERGISLGTAFFPWRRVVSYEWDIAESVDDDSVVRPRQLVVRVLTQAGDGPEEHRVAADRFEVGPWTISMAIPDRVEPETGRTVLRRVTVPWHRVLEYERMLADARIAQEVPGRPDMEEAPPHVDIEAATAETAAAALPGSSRNGDGSAHVVDVAAAERKVADELPASPESGSRPGGGR
jgi:hypothetical protein